MSDEMDGYFTDEKIEQLVTRHNWELVPSVGDMYKLRQKDKHYMTSFDFHATDETVRKFCVAQKVELPYMVYTSRKYEVTGPDKDGEIGVETEEHDGRYDYLYFNADDLRMMLDRIERGKK